MNDRKVTHPDLSPIVVESVCTQSGMMRAEPPLRFEVRCDEGMYSLKGDFGIVLGGAYTRREMLIDLHDHIAFLWREYALEDPSEMTEDAVSLKNELRSRLLLVQSFQSAKSYDDFTKSYKLSEP